MLAFISYAKVDKPVVQEKIVEYLRCAGINPWFDYFLPVGQNWQDVLVDAIEKCDVFIYALTPESLASKWCRWELAKAQELEKPVIPVLLRKNAVVSPELGLKEIQYADFSDGATGEAIARLIGGLYNMSFNPHLRSKSIINIGTVLTSFQLDGEPPHAIIDSAIVDGKESIDKRYNIVEQDSKQFRSVRICWIDVLGDLITQIPPSVKLELHPLYLYEGNLFVQVQQTSRIFSDHANEIQQVILQSLGIRGVKVRGLSFME